MGEDRNGQRAGRGKPSTDYTGTVAGYTGTESGYRGTESGRGVLAEKLGELARSMQRERGVEDTLDAITRAAAETVPGAEEASISAVIGGREVRTHAATGELPRAVDRAQYETGEGPCLDSLYHLRSLRLPDIGSEPRWPAFCARATEVGVRSMLAVQLYVDGQDLGALNLHSRQVDAFTDESEEIALIFASHAAVAFAGAQTQEQLETAIDRRDLIGQAKGVLIERYKISGQEAFRLLVVASQTTNIKLFDVAEYLVRTGELAAPGKRTRPPGEPEATAPPGN